MILIHKQIGNSVDKRGNVTYGVNGSEFAAEMLYLERVCKKITVRINSIGGNVLDGYGIAASIYNCSLPVTTIIDGLAASTALWCAAAGSVRKTVDFGAGMMHGSSGGDDKEMTDFVDKTINLQLSNRSGKTPEEITAMMGKETWMDAKEMKAAGLVDEIISTDKKIKIKKTDSLQNMATIYNSLTKPKNMSKLNTLLKISNNADESEQEAQVAKLNSDLAAQAAENETLKNKVTALEKEKSDKADADKATLKTKATEMVNAAVTAGKLKKEEVDFTIENASKDQGSFDFVSNMLNRMGSTKEAAKIFNPQNIAGASTAKGGREEWTIRDWEKKDPKGLGEMKNSAPEQYEEMYNSFYKK